MKIGKENGYRDVQNNFWGNRLVLYRKSASQPKEKEEAQWKRVAPRKDCEVWILDFLSTKKRIFAFLFFSFVSLTVRIWYAERVGEYHSIALCPNFADVKRRLPMTIVSIMRSIVHRVLPSIGVHGGFRRGGQWMQLERYRGQRGRHQSHH